MAAGNMKTWWVTCDPRDVGWRPINRRNLQQIPYVPTRLTSDDAASTQLSITTAECFHSDIQENHEKNGNELVISVSYVCFVTPLV